VFKKDISYTDLAFHNSKDLDMVFCIMTLLSGMGYQYFKGTYSFHLHDPEDGSVSVLKTCQTDSDTTNYLPEL
jgi:hypothetical protein